METKKYQLPKEFAEKWVKALRSSPEAMHGSRTYYNPNTKCYCAMGLAYVANDIKLGETGSFVKPNQIDPFANETGKQPVWFEVMDMNDNKEKSFSEIADWVEANVEFV